jgi:translation initiation factor IF-3
LKEQVLVLCKQDAAEPSLRTMLYGYGIYKRKLSTKESKTLQEVVVTLKQISRQFEGACTESHTLSCGHPS